MKEAHASAEIFTHHCIIVAHDIRPLGTQEDNTPGKRLYVQGKSILAHGMITARERATSHEIADIYAGSH